MSKADLIFAAGENSADILYASGFKAPDPFIYFNYHHERAVIVSALEQDRAEKECRRNISVLGRNDFSKDDKVSDIDVISLLAESRGIREFRVPHDFPLAMADELRERGLKIEAEKKLFYPERQYKSESELSNIRDAMRIAERGLCRGIDIISDAKINSNGILEWDAGILTSEILQSEINICMLRDGGFSDSTIASCGSHAAEPHNSGSGPIYANKTVIMDVFPRIRKSGYWGDITRTVVKGKAPDIVKKAYKAVFEAREHAKSLIKPGAIPSEIHQTAKGIMEGHGFNTGRQDGRNFGFFHGLGHSVGLEIHEKPSLSPINNNPLKGGEVITVEPGLYYHEWGGVRLEDMIVVTNDGCDCITEMQDILEI